MVTHACTTCKVKVHSFSSDERACPVCQIPMVSFVPASYGQDKVRAVRSVVVKRYSGAAGAAPR